MIAIEFQTTINEGMIKIPEEYKIQNNESIKVIVLFEEIQKDKDENGIIDNLLKNPLKNNSFIPFKREEMYE